MHHPDVPLDWKEIFASPAISGDDDPYGIPITLGLITKCISRVHGDALYQVFKDRPTLHPTIPALDLLPINKTKFYQLGSIDRDEGTIVGGAGVHVDAIAQMGLKHPTPDDMATYLEDHGEPLQNDFPEGVVRQWLFHGDQLTAKLIRTIKREQKEALLPFDRRDWILGIPAWFHVQMNLSNLLIRSHLGPPQSTKQYTAHCLTADLQYLGKTVPARDSPKYHIMEPAMTQSFTARVLLLFYTALEDQHLLPDTAKTSVFWENPAAVGRTIAALTPDQFLELVEQVRQTAFTLKAYEGHNQPDPEFTTMCRMLQQIELFETVHHAVKQGDIGLLRRLVDPLIIFFWGSGQTNYGQEMIHLRWLLSDNVCDEVLQHSILASSIVNWHGQRDTHKAIDLGLEHLNGSAKIEMKCYKNSTHDEDIIFNRVCLTNTYIRQLRTVFEGYFGEFMSGSHTTANASRDIFAITRKLATANLGRPRALEDIGDPSRYYQPADYITLGASEVEAKVMEFNAGLDIIRDDTSLAEQRAQEPVLDPVLINESRDSVDNPAVAFEDNDPVGILPEL